ncbi:MAG: AsmA family protein [Elusimicrobia bacterium]|nr:AsmA family protein [Elusimicrobiota bacterium]
MSKTALSIEKKIRKIVRSVIFNFAVVVIVLITLSPAIFRFLIGIDTLVGWTLAELSEALGRQITVAEASIGFWGGVDLKQVMISEYPSFRDGVFIKADRLRFKADLFRLALGSLEVDKLKIAGASVNLKRDSQGRWNLEHFFKSAVDQPKVLDIGDEAEPQIKLGSIAIDDFEMSDSRVVFDDETGKIPAFRFNDIALAVQGFSPRKTFSLSLSLLAQLDRGSTALSTQTASYGAGSQALLAAQCPLKAVFKSRVNLAGGDLGQAKFELKELKLESSAWDLSVQGGLESLDQPKADLNIKAEFDGFALNLGAINSSALASGSSATLKAHGTLIANFQLKTEDADRRFKWYLDADALAVQFNDRFHKDGKTPLSILLQGRRQAGRQSKKTGEDDDDAGGQGPGIFDLEGSADFLFGQGIKDSIGHWAVKVKNSRHEEGLEAPAAVDDEAQEKLPAWPETDLDGFSGETRWEISLSSLSLSPAAIVSMVPAISRDYHFIGGKLTCAGLRFSGGSDFWNLDVQKAKLRQARLDSSQNKVGRLEAGLEHLNFMNRRGRWKLEFAGAFEASRADTVFLAARDLIAQADMKGIANEKDPNLAGEIHVHLNNGAIKDVPAVVAKMRFMKFLIHPLRIMEDLTAWKVLKLEGRDFQSLPMDSMQGDYYFQDGKMSLDKVTVSGPMGNCQVSGGVDFPHDQINLMVAVNMPREKIRWPMAESFEDEKGNTYLHIKVKGPLKQPSVNIVMGPKKDMLKELEEQFAALKQKTKGFLRK